MKNTLFISKKNATFQQILAIKNNRDKRNETNAFFVEGVRNINLAIKYGWKIRNWIFNSYESLSSWAKNILDNYRALNLSFSKELLAEISGKTDTSELMAIVEKKENKIKPSKNPFIILFDRPSKKGNLGSMIRSADAFGVDGIIVTGHAVDIYDSEVIASSMGSFFSLPVEKLDRNEDVVNKIDELKQTFSNLQVVGTDETGDENIRKFNFKVPTILLVGNESKGLSRFLKDVCNNLVKIPMVGEASSFNASCAGSIFMYEIFTQRQE